MRIDVSHAFLPKQHSTRAAQVMDHFGIGFEQGRHVIAAGLEIPIEPGNVVLFNGASGSGKSSLLRGVAVELRRGGGSPASIDGAMQADGSSTARRNGPSPPAPLPACSVQEVEHGSAGRGGMGAVLDVNDLDLGDRILIESLPVETEQAMHLLSACGLGEAQLMLRTPAELSDGQRYRFRLALGLAFEPQWIMADEFTATLDRTLARVIAFNIRRLADRTGIGCLLATTHDDVAEDLDADVRVVCRLDGEVRVERRKEASCCALTPGPSPGMTRDGVDAGPAGRGGTARKKKEGCRSRGSCGSVRRPSATGRTSLGGITAAITSG